MYVCLKRREIQREIDEDETATDHSWDILLSSIGKVKQLSLYIQQAPEPRLEMRSPERGEGVVVIEGLVVGNPRPSQTGSRISSSHFFIRR